MLRLPNELGNGGTGRNLATLTEHKRETRKGDVNNHSSEYHRLTYHAIDWGSAKLHNLHD